MIVANVEWAEKNQHENAADNAVNKLSTLGANVVAVLNNLIKLSVGRAVVR
jgi:hypothetical protein